LFPQKQNGTSYILSQCHNIMEKHKRWEAFSTEQKQLKAELNTHSRILTKCSCVIRMSNAILFQPVHQDVRVELSHKIDSDTEALSIKHWSCRYQTTANQVAAENSNNSYFVIYHNCYSSTHTSNFRRPCNVYVVRCGGWQMTLRSNIDGKTRTLRFHTQLVSWYRWLHINRASSCHHHHRHHHRHHCYHHHVQVNCGAKHIKINWTMANNNRSVELLTVKCQFEQIYRQMSKKFSTVEYWVTVDGCSRLKMQSIGLGWASLTSHSTHFRSFWRRWGGCGISQDCSHSQSPQCAVLSSMCATTVDNSGVYMYYLKGIVSVCFRCPARTVGFSGTRPYLCIYNQPSWVTLKCCPPPG